MWYIYRGQASKGPIEACTIVIHQFEELPEPPYPITYVLPDGSGTALLSFVKGVDLSDARKASKELKIRRQMRVVFHRLRHGQITDFHYRVA